MFVKLSRPKKFGCEHGTALDRNEKNLVICKINWANTRLRSGRQHRGPITRTFLEVAKALLFGFHNSKSGRCFPSYEAIAEKAGCARSTVHKAIRALEDAGILTWIHRLAHWRDANHKRRVVRTSNAYFFNLTERVAQLVPADNSKSENQIGTLNQDSFSLRRPSWRPRQNVTFKPRAGLSPEENDRASALHQLERLSEVTQSATSLRASAHQNSCALSDEWLRRTRLERQAHLKQC